MADYSHSRITTFENCPYKYKLHYIDEITPDFPNTIEAFMGGIVHETLEKLYRDKLNGKINSIIITKIFYKETWEKRYDPNILIAKYGMVAEDYRQIGWKFVYHYYHNIFLNETLNLIGIETEEMLTLPDGNRWHIRIDKLGKDKNNNYFVCDYKTNSRMKTQEEADKDNQLAMYSIWVKQNHPEAKSVKLIWHMLAFNETVISERNVKQENKLLEEILKKIREVEQAEKDHNFPKKPSILCDYCTYKKTCWKK